MAMLDKPHQRSAHRDDIVSRMRREDQDPFRKRLRPFRPVAVVCIVFSARPAGDGVLYIVKYTDVYIISLSEICTDSVQSVFIVLEIRKYQYSLFHPEPTSGHRFPTLPIIYLPILVSHGRASTAP